MIRPLRHAALALSLLALAALPAAAKDARSKSGKPESSKSETAAKGGKGGKGGSGKSSQVGSYGDWGAFVAQGKGKTCYALAKPKERTPASLKRDDAYIFISNRPAENVRNEVSVIMGFAMTDAKNAAPKGDPSAEIGNVSFGLVAKGANAWLKNPAEEGRFIEALKKGSKLVVRATSLKGHASTDVYSLAGVGDALARIHKDCP
ncbi:MAG: hypothetical protein KGM42_07615 [Hyphomicrobiales bacterium]|nr:hypothetical protein [Hyphomicrobiales bacterium]